MAPIRWGIIGTGNIAGQFAHGLVFVDDAQLVAVGSRRRETADRFGDEFDVPHRHASYAELAADADVEIVYVATPHVYHAENSLLCLRHGKAVLCEKPFTINAAEAEQVIEYARGQQLFLMEAVWTRLLPHMEKVVELVQDGAIGEPRLLQANFCFRTRFNPEARLFAPALGGGSLLDVGIYPVYLAHLLLGQPNEIRTLAHLGKTGVDEQAGIVLGHEGGAVSVLTSAIRASLPHTATIGGTEGTILIHHRWWAPTHFTLKRDGHDDETYHPPVVGNGYNYEASEAGRCLRAGRAESEKLPLATTLAVMRTLDAIRAQWGLRYPGEEQRPVVSDQ